MDIVNNNVKLAVLIDADNISYSNIKRMLNEIAKYGTPTIKRIYGDWTKPSVERWKAPLLEHAITPIQQYSYTTGKNATDSAMIIDAMDILHEQKVDGFCLISSDSDFTRLAVRLRESGMRVIGLGEKKTPKPFIVACETFIYIENIDNPDIVDNGNSTKTVENLQAEHKTSLVDKELIRDLKKAIHDISDETDWVFLAELGNYMRKNQPDFDSRNYGFPKLMSLIKSLGNHFEIDQRVVPGERIKHIYVKVK